MPADARRKTFRRCHTEESAAAEDKESASLPALAISNALGSRWATCRESAASVGDCVPVAQMPMHPIRYEYWRLVPMGSCRRRRPYAILVALVDGAWAMLSDMESVTCRLVSVFALAITALAWPALPARAQTIDQPAIAAPEHQVAGTISNGSAGKPASDSGRPAPKDDRIFGVMPNYTTVEGSADVTASHHGPEVQDAGRRCIRPLFTSL